MKKKNAIKKKCVLTGARITPNNEVQEKNRRQRPSVNKTMKKIDKNQHEKTFE